MIKKESNSKTKDIQKKSYALLLTINGKKFKKIDNEMFVLNGENVIFLNNCIIECSFEKKKVFVFLRKRNEKKRPNNLWVSKEIVKSIKEKRKKKKILEKIEEYDSNKKSHVRKKLETSLG